MKIFKLLFFAIILGVVLNSCVSDKVNKDLKEVPEKYINKEDPAILTRTDTLFDFGEITEGDVVEHEFEFTNTGNTPLILVDAKSSCGCTVPEIPKEPVAPGEKGILKVRFNSKYKKGDINKKIRVAANTYPETTNNFYLRGVVNKPK